MKRSVIYRVGPAIIKERKKGEFKSFEDFQRVKGIGEKMALKVKNSVKSSSNVQKTGATKI